ncbi:MAG: hypothetical protein H7315_10360 [Herminiimonas sp.]|nr:hypothetical protein [Herminiimonas sp.]
MWRKLTARRVNVMPCFIDLPTQSLFFFLCHAAITSTVIGIPLTLVVNRLALSRIILLTGILVSASLIVALGPVRALVALTASTIVLVALIGHDIT